MGGPVPCGMPVDPPEAPCVGKTSPEARNDETGKSHLLGSRNHEDIMEIS